MYRSKHLGFACNSEVVRLPCKRKSPHLSGAWRVGVDSEPGDTKQLPERLKDQDSCCQVDTSAVASRAPSGECSVMKVVPRFRDLFLSTQIPIPTNHECPPGDV